MKRGDFYRAKRKNELTGCGVFSVEMLLFGAFKGKVNVLCIFFDHGERAKSSNIYSYRPISKK
ncbi:MAG: hypothetical protein WBL02_06705 [Methanomethylovorans sp.]|uniref:hypothetical protein n=1 Tax=Methanomethylovorans sp. TaxID=2758717 RepID=UPI003C768579